MKTQQIYTVLEDYSNRQKLKGMVSSANKGGFQLLCEDIEDGLSIVGARPCMGSTSFVISMALELAKAGKRVLMYGNPHHKIEYKISRYVGRKEGCSCPFLKDVPFYYGHLFFADDFHILKARIFEDVIQLHPQYIFIDSLRDIIVDERLVSTSLSPEEFMCRDLRNLSYQIDIPIVAVAGLNRNTERRAGVEGKIPHTSDFRGGDLEYYASKVYLPYRPEYYHIYNDERTGRDIRGCMYIYGSGLGNYTGMELKFDYRTFRVYDPERENWVSEDGSTQSDLPF